MELKIQLNQESGETILRCFAVLGLAVVLTVTVHSCSTNDNLSSMAAQTNKDVTMRNKIILARDAIARGANFRMTAEGEVTVSFPPKPKPEAKVEALLTVMPVIAP